MEEDRMPWRLDLGRSADDGPANDHVHLNRCAQHAALYG